MERQSAREYVKDFPRLVAWIEQEIGHSCDDLVSLEMAAEMIEREPSPDMWQHFEPGNHLYVTATFRDEYAITRTFKRDEIAYVPRQFNVMEIHLSDE